MRIKALLFLIVVSISALTTVHGVAQAATFTVNSTGDTGDFSTGDGICSDGTGICTLRAAIEEANAIAGADSIAFDIPTTDIGYASSTDSFLIQPSSALPTITSPVTIDGYTQPGASANTNGPGLGSNAVLKIELDGSTAGSFITGLKITAGSSVVRGLAINRFDANGIEMSENGGNLIEGSFIGVDITGTISLGNDSHGVLVQDVSNNTFGGTTEVARNVISGNNFAGIALNGMDASGNIVQGNFVGTDLNGTIALPNRGGGVSILDSPDNILGGTEPGAGNLLSGNDQNGVTIYNVNATGNLMQGNLIGTDLTGTVGLGNGLYGVIIEDAPGNTIGGTTEAARNIISGNDSSGIVLLSRSAFENTVQGNFVGTDITGTFAIPNATHSIIIDDAPRNLIGGLTAGARNIISGNAEGGVVIGGLDATGNIVQGNFIGTDVTGTVALGNDLSGVAIQDASDNIIGGTAAARNIISGNGRSGVIIFGIDSTNNIVQGNFIGTDVTGAIAMGNDTDGVVMLDASDNTIGGSVAGEGNLISGNEGNGVLILGSSATNNLVHGNLIGTDFNGIAALGNDASGVSIQDGSSNTIGGITPEERNIISANSGSGVTISGDVTGNLLQGNFIGTDVTGTIALGNSVSGVILGNTPANTIGGTATGAGNVISANSGTGIIISGVGSTGNLVQGNLVGTDLTGMIALGNTSQGVLIYGASSNTIGGATSGARNIISGNGAGGIAIVSEGATGTLCKAAILEPMPLATRLCLTTAVASTYWRTTTLSVVPLLERAT